MLTNVRFSQAQALKANAYGACRHRNRSPGRTLQAAAHGGGTQRDDQEQRQEDEEPDGAVGTLLLLDGVVDGRAIRPGVGRGHRIRRILDIRHDVLDVVGTDRLGGHPTVGADVAVDEGFDVGVTGGGCRLRILDPLDQNLFAGSPAVGDARQIPARPGPRWSPCDRMRSWR